MIDRLIFVNAIVGDRPGRSASSSAIGQNTVRESIVRKERVKTRRRDVNVRSIMCIEPCHVENRNAEHTLVNVHEFTLSQVLINYGRLILQTVLTEPRYL